MNTKKLIILRNVFNENENLEKPGIDEMSIDQRNFMLKYDEDEENNQNLEPETQNEIHNYEENEQNESDNAIENAPMQVMMSRSRNTLKIPVWYQANFNEIILSQRYEDAMACNDGKRMENGNQSRTRCVK